MGKSQGPRRSARVIDRHASAHQPAPATHRKTSDERKELRHPVFPGGIYTEDCTLERMAVLLQLNGEQLTSLSADRGVAI